MSEVQKFTEGSTLHPRFHEQLEEAKKQLGAGPTEKVEDGTIESFVDYDQGSKKEDAVAQEPTVVAENPEPSSSSSSSSSDESDLLASSKPSKFALATTAGSSKQRSAGISIKDLIDDAAELSGDDSGDDEDDDDDEEENSDGTPKPKWIDHTNSGVEPSHRLAFRDKDIESEKADLKHLKRFGSFEIVKSMGVSPDDAAESDDNITPEERRRREKEEQRIIDRETRAALGDDDDEDEDNDDAMDVEEQEEEEEVDEDVGESDIESSDFEDAQLPARAATVERSKIINRATTDVVGAITGGGAPSVSGTPPFDFVRAFISSVNSCAIDCPVKSGDNAQARSLSESVDSTMNEILQSTDKVTAATEKKIQDDPSLEMESTRARLFVTHLPRVCPFKVVESTFIAKRDCQCAATNVRISKGDPMILIQVLLPKKNKTLFFPIAEKVRVTQNQQRSQRPKEEKNTKKAEKNDTDDAMDVDEEPTAITAAAATQSDAKGAEKPLDPVDDDDDNEEMLDDDEEEEMLDDNEEEAEAQVSPETEDSRTLVCVKDAGTLAWFLREIRDNKDRMSAKPSSPGKPKAFFTEQGELDSKTRPWAESAAHAAVNEIFEVSCDLDRRWKVFWPTLVSNDTHRLVVDPNDIANFGIEKTADGRFVAPKSSGLSDFDFELATRYLNQDAPEEVTDSGNAKEACSMIAKQSFSSSQVKNLHVGVRAKDRRKIAHMGKIYFYPRLIDSLFKHSV